ncbi:hypothetical protein MC885_003976 [Smutsia gigantea]|nr:hypothetical protein MC885_003976 [Smutsia gigantea]
MRLEWWGFRPEGHGVRDGPPPHSVAPDLCQFLGRGEGLPLEVPVQDAGAGGDRWGPGLNWGEIEFGGSGKKRSKFVKVPSSVAPSQLFNLLLAEWHLPFPNLVVSLVGEERPFAMKSWLRDILRKGLVKAAQSTGAWILTSALRVGLARHIGQAVRDHSLASTSSKACVVAIGIGSLGRVLHRQLLDDAQEEHPTIHYPTHEGGGQGPTCSLDGNHAYFILVEPGPPGKGDGLTELQLRLEKHVSEQRTSYRDLHQRPSSASVVCPVRGPQLAQRRSPERFGLNGNRKSLLAAIRPENETEAVKPRQGLTGTPSTGTGSIEIPVLCLLVSGDPGTLERISRAVEQHAAPWLILAGSGGIADVLAALMSQPHLLVPQLAERELKEKFPSQHFSWEDIKYWTQLLQNITSYPHLLTVHDFEQDSSEELETVILKALLKACKSHSQQAQDYLDELKLAMAWDRVDIAKSEIFNGDVEWKARDLEEVLMDALVSNKPEFVRLFVDNGADVAAFLTYGRLQQLYLSATPQGLLFELLQHKRRGGRLALASLGAPQAQEPPAFSLLEVSRVLKDFLQDACHGLYQAESGPARQPEGQKWLLDLNQRSKDPWRDLFLWAVLQSHHEMASYFWAMGQEGVAAALAACKILKEMSHLEMGAEVGRMCEAKYEQLALDLFSECYSNSEDHAFALLVRRNRCWSRTTCLHLATEADTKAFFAHDGVQAFLTKIWWGDMASGTPVLRLLGAFLCPALIYTNLITFSEEVPLRTGPDDLQELDSLGTERSRLCSRVEELAKAPRAQGGRGPRATFLLTRWRKFWGAPVTVFLGNVVMYFAFLFLFAYILLVDFWPPPQGPSGPEFMLYFWVFTLVLEEIRQGFFTDEDTHLLKKLTLYVEDNWNKCDMMAIFLFVGGITCRSEGLKALQEQCQAGCEQGRLQNGARGPQSPCFPAPGPMLPSVFEAGRAVLALDFMVFTLRLIHIFAIHKQLGPKIIVVERMMKDVFFFLFFLSVWLVAYGVTTQALLHPHDGRLEWIFRHVLYRPYLQIFGQIPLDEIDEARVNCSAHPLLLEDSPSCPNLYANWLVILLLVAFLLVTNVLLMNLLIAMFSYTFQVVQGNADMFWKFQRYHLIVEYQERPSLAPPFILLSHLSLVLRRAFQKEAKQRRACLGKPMGLDMAWLPGTLCWGPSLRDRQRSRRAGRWTPGRAQSSRHRLSLEVPAPPPCTWAHCRDSSARGQGSCRLEQLHLPWAPEAPWPQPSPPAALASAERDLPEPLDQKMVTWEAVQKENYLGKLERQRKDSEEEVLRKTAHRVGLIAKHLGGLREQERRVKLLESQINYCTVLLTSMADTLAQGSAYWNSWNFGGGNLQASADHGRGLGSKEHEEAGQLPSDT